MTTRRLSPQKQMPLLDPQGASKSPADSEGGGASDVPLTAEVLAGGAEGSGVTCTGSLCDLGHRLLSSLTWRENRP